MTWTEDQKWEAEWWNNCANTFWEEVKQQVYAEKMGLIASDEYGHYPVYDMKGKSIVDIGGGPVSMLLKCKNIHGVVIDPCSYPKWVEKRYKETGIIYLNRPAEQVEKLANSIFDEAWIYNCLQHTVDPEQIIKNALKMAKVIRIFEWVDAGVSVGHPQNLTEKNLNKWLGGIGQVENIDRSGCHGKCYYGVFKGEKYV